MTCVANYVNIRKVTSKSIDRLLRHHQSNVNAARACAAGIHHSLPHQLSDNYYLLHKMLLLG